MDALLQVAEVATPSSAGRASPAATSRRSSLSSDQPASDGQYRDAAQHALGPASARASLSGEALAGASQQASAPASPRACPAGAELAEAEQLEVMQVLVHQLQENVGNLERLVPLAHRFRAALEVGAAPAVFSIRSLRMAWACG